MKVHLLTRGGELGAKSLNVAWLATLVAYLDNLNGFTRDAPVCMHRLYAKRSLGVLGGVQAVAEASFHTFNLASDEVTGVVIFRVVVIVIVIILLEIPLFRAHSTDKVLPLSEFVRADIEG